MTRKTYRKPSGETKPCIDKGREMQESIIDESAEPEDSGRDLLHGEGGTIDLPTRPGDLSKDD